MDHLLQDLRLAGRSILRAPAFTLLVVGILALGIGSNAVIFSVVNAVLLKPLPFREPSRLVRIFELNREISHFSDGPSPANVLDWQAKSRAFGGIAASSVSSATFLGEDGAEEILVSRVTAEFFPVLGTKPEFGRWFTPEEVAAGARVVVLSRDFFERRFGGDPAVLEKTIRLAGADWRVLGVMPRGFTYPSRESALWQPTDFRRAYETPPRDFRFLTVVARMKPGLTLQQAQSDLEAVASAISEADPRTSKGWSVRLSPLHEEIVRGARPTLLLLWGAVGFVLLITCANVASLLLVRALERQPQTAIRLALGCSRRRLVRQCLTESVLLALAGGVLGYGVSHFGLVGLLRLYPGDLPRLEEISLDRQVLGFTLVASLATGIAFGLAPALFGTASTLQTVIRASGQATATRSRRRVRRGLTIAEVAVAVVLWVGAGLLVRSFSKLVAVDPGFDRENLVVMSIRLGTNYSGDSCRNYYRTLVEKLEALPGVQSAAAVTALPLREFGSDFDRPFWRDGETPEPGNVPEVNIRMATPGYFKTMRMPLTRGRELSEWDRADSTRVVVVNEAVADALWPNQDPVSKRIVIDYLKGPYPYEVVGVVGNTRFYGLRNAPVPEAYLPHAQVPYLPMNVVARTSVDPDDLRGAVRRVAREIDPAQPLHAITTMERLVSDSVARDRFAVSLMTFLATLALLLAATGVYGLLAYGVRQRRKEMGVRLALGAKRRTLLWLVVRESLKLTLVGTATGLLVAHALSGLTSRFLFGVTRTDPVTFLGVTLLLLGVGCLSAFLPARRATGVDLIEALREE